MAGDPLCEERPAPEHQNECCVLVVCASVEEAEKDRTGNSGSTATSSGKSEKSQDNLQFLQITPTTVQVQFPDITGGNLMYIEDTLFQKSLNKDNIPWENAIILEGNKIFTLTGLSPGTKYRLRWQTPEIQYPDVEVSTQLPSNPKAPKVIVTEKTFDSITLSFDHFAPENYRHGYVALYKPVNETRWQTQEGSLTNKDLPTINIGDLKPNVEYEARIAIYEDFSLRSLGKSTGIINVKTKNGCIYEKNNQAYGVGLFNVACDLSCECFNNGTVKCDKRCRPPYHKQGTTAGDPLCVEQSVDGDDCCVIVTCAGTSVDDGHDGPCSDIKCGPNAKCRHEVFRGDQVETICVCKEGYTGDPDSKEGCYEHSPQPDRVTISPRDGCLVNNQTYSVGQKWNDGCDYTCTCSLKLEILCQVF